MQDEYDEELQEVYASVSNTIAILQEAVEDAQTALDTAEVEASADTFAALVQMLRRLRESNICIETLCEQALQEE
jgi:hypothetical protein